MKAKVFLATLAGAGLGAALQSLLMPGWEGESALWRERLFLVFAGSALAATILGVLFALLGSRPLHGLVVGLCIGVVPLLAPGPAVGVPAAVIGAWLAARLAARLPARLATVAGSRPILVLGAATLLAPLVVLAAVPGERSPLRTAPEPHIDMSVTGSRRGPDVVLVVADTLRADALLDPDIPTPHLDGLRRRSTWARYALAPSNQTLPSHLSLLCGLDIEQLGMRSNLSRWPGAAQLVEEWGCVPVAERFRQSGYRTAAVVTNPLLNQVEVDDPRQDPAEGFETWNGQHLEDPFWQLLDWKRERTWLGWLSYPARLSQVSNVALRRLLYSHGRRLLRAHAGEGARTADATLSYLRVLEQRPEPYFLFVHFMDPHSPYVPAAPYRGTLSEALRAAGGYSDDPLDEFALRQELRESLESGAPPGRLGAYLHALYREEVAALDAELGRILDHLEGNGRQAWILFTSDHGELFGEHGSMEHGSTLFRGELEVPFLLSGPGIPADRELSDPPELVDGVATLLQLARVPDQGTAGRDLLAGAPARAILSVSGSGCAIQRGRWKARFRLRYPEPAATGVYELELLGLFDLELDPDELRDLAAEQPEQARRLEELTRARLARDLYPKLPPRELRWREQRLLSQLGYAE